ncbi:hypothetical protein D3C81_610160 [compost metagenome]
MLQQRDLVHELVAGGAVDLPVAVQLLVGTEDLLDKNRKVLQRRLKRALGQQPVDPAAQLAAVATGVGQTVNVVNPQAVDQAAADQLEHLAVGGLEHRRTLHPQAAQLIDVEEASPVDIVAGGAPAGQAIGLAFE